MEIESVIQEKKKSYSSLMEFIDNTENYEFDLLIKEYEKHENIKNKEIIPILQLLSKIADNHHRLPDFFDKFGKILQYLFKNKESAITDLEIYQIFKDNKRILLLLLERGLIQPDEQIISDIMISKDKNDFPYSHYLYSGIKPFINEDQIQTIEGEIRQIYNEEINNFVEKCRIGENDSYISTLIRKDSVEDFISHINRTSTSLMSKIEPSIFETNLYLINKRPTLIEYASFFGSIQIIQYLRYSKVNLKSSLWIYSIHSNNAELIHFLEENEVRPCDEEEVTNKKIFEESIICHHNAIADYIKDNFLEKTHIDNFGTIIVNCYNYHYYPSEISYVISKMKNKNGFNISQLCFSLKQITIPSSVTEIGESAFRECLSITQIIIPSSVKLIKSYAFEKCSSLKNITIPSSVTEIRNSAFEKCSSLTEVLIQSSITSIKNCTFRGCSSLKQITIPSSVTSIGNSAFEKCSSLIQISIPSSVYSIGDYAFRECSSLTQITIPSAVTKIKSHVFEGCSLLKKLSIPSSVTSIKCCAFEKCSSLLKIEIPSSVTKIGDCAFKECSSLVQLSIPSSVTSIGNYAFYNCSSLEQISIPSSKTEIGADAFKGCKIQQNELKKFRYLK